MKNQECYTAEEVAKIAIIYGIVRPGIKDETKGKGNDITKMITAGYERNVPDDIRNLLSKLEKAFETNENKFTELIKLE